MKTTLNKDRIKIFSGMLNTIMTNLGHAGQVIGYRNCGRNKIIFQFRMVGDVYRPGFLPLLIRKIFPVTILDSVYPKIQDDDDLIRNAVNADDMDMRKHNGNLELRFTRSIVNQT